MRLSCRCRYAAGPKCVPSKNSAGHLLAQTVARHDIFWTTHNGFGWYWATNGDPYAGDYRSETLVCTAAQEYDIAALRAANPRIKILRQIQHYGARLDGDQRGDEHLPANHPWWKRDSGGNLVPAPLAGDAGVYSA